VSAGNHLKLGRKVPLLYQPASQLGVVDAEDLALVIEQVQALFGGVPKRFDVSLRESHQQGQPADVVH